MLLTYTLISFKIKLLEKNISDLQFSKYEKDFKSFRIKAKDSIKREGFEQRRYGDAFLREDIKEISQRLDQILEMDNDAYLMNRKSIKSDLEQLNKIKTDINITRTDYKKLKKTLNTPITVKIIDKLQNSIELKIWVEKAFKYHKEQDLKVCGFCGNPISDNRWSELSDYFNEEKDRVNKELQNFLLKLEDLKNDFSRLNLPDKEKICINYVSKYEGLRKRITETFACMYDDNVHLRIKKLLEDKKLNPEKSILIEKKINRDFFNCLKIFKDSIKEINEIIENHNNYSEETDEINKICRLYYIKNHFYDNYIEKSKELKDKEKKQECFNEQLDSAKRDLTEINNQLSNQNPNLINEFICKITGHQLFRLSLNKDENAYELERNILGDFEPAYEVSEGEKTIISFAYFISSLQEENKSLEDLIVVIDDPISSLDNKYIYNIINIIKKEIISKKTKQLFILTHNFYFFKKIRRFLQLNKNEKEGEKDKNKNIYQINKNQNSSYIEKGNEFLKTYNNEYMFLANEIKRIYEKTNEEYDYHLGLNVFNCIRRFLEIFLSFKYPKVTKGDGVNKLLNEALEELEKDNIDKNFNNLEFLINEYSHGQITDVELSIDFSKFNDVKSFIENEFFAFMELVDREHFQLLNIRV